MAADKLSKRFKVSHGVCHSSWEVQKVKKTKYSHYDLITKSRICLEWDDKKECVVPKKEQISIAQRELTQFLPFVAHHQNVLGEVFAAPPELFELNNLTGLLSYEVWQTHLSTQEREFLTQFLPEGAEPHAVVHELLAGNNLHFGNSFQKWGTSICSGDYHPDAILRHEQRNKANKVAYYSELQKYHTRMIGSLQSWKERWTISMNPECFMQNIPRPKRDFKSGSAHETGLQNGQQHDLCVTSGSCSWDADDKLCNSGSPDLSGSNGETLLSASRTDSGNKYHNSSGGRSAARPEKGEKKLNIECGDGAKYMSYIKVSKEQHERVKRSMKQSNTSIQPRSLNLVLGNLDGLCVQPYELFEEEERQKLHDHWLHLAKKDLPAGFENWRSWQSAKWQVTMSLRKEMEDKWKSNEEPILNLYNNQDDEIEIDRKVEETEQSCDEQQDGEKINDALFVTLEENMKQNDISEFQSEADLNSDNHDATNKFSQDYAKIHDATNESSQDYAENHDATNKSSQDYAENHDATNKSSQDYAESHDATNKSSQDYAEIHDATNKSSQDYAEIHDATNKSSQDYAENYDATNKSSQDYAENHDAMNKSSQDSGQHQNFCPMPINTNSDAITESEAFPSSLVDYPESIDHTDASIGEQFSLPSSATDVWPLAPLPNMYHHQPTSVSQDYPSVGQSSFLNRRSESGDSFFNPYASQDRNELLLHSLYKDPPNSHYMGTSQLSRNLSLPLPLDPRLNTQQNVYADKASRFPLPREEHLLPLDQAQGWPGTSVVNLPMSATSHHRLSQNWLSDDDMARGRWSGGLVPNHGISSGGQVVDESLYSVLSECNGLRSGVRYASTEIIQPGNYVEVGRETVLPTTTNGVPHQAARGSGVNYMSGNEAPLGWMNVPRALQDSGVKPFARFWNDRNLG